MDHPLEVKFGTLVLAKKSFYNILIVRGENHNNILGYCVKNQHLNVEEIKNFLGGGNQYL